ISKPRDSATRVTQPATDGKTCEALYQHLKAKGWQLKESKPTNMHVFDSEESVNFYDERNIGFLAMRFENPEKAQASFDRIDNTYRRRNGRAVMSKNFIIGIWGFQKGINHPEIIQLNDSEYKTLQDQMNEFTHS